MNALPVQSNCLPSYTAGSMRSQQPVVFISEFYPRQRFSANGLLVPLCLKVEQTGVVGVVLHEFFVGADF